MNYDDYYSRHNPNREFKIRTRPCFGRIEWFVVGLTIALFLFIAVEKLAGWN
jgi:uncharacterized membrane protein